MKKVFTSTGMPRNASRMNENFVAVRPNGRPSRLSFSSPFRAANWVMEAFGCDTWTELHQKGWTIQPISWL